MELPTGQEKSKQIFSPQPKTHQYKFADTNKTVPMDSLRLIVFLSSVKLLVKQPASLTSSRRKRSRKRRRRLIFLLLAAVIQATSSIVTRTATTIKTTSAIAMNDDMTVAIEMINTTITLVAKTRTTRKSLMRRRMIASAFTSRKRVRRPCTTFSPLC